MEDKAFIKEVKAVLGGMNSITEVIAVLLEAKTVFLEDKYLFWRRKQLILTDLNSDKKSYVTNCQYA